MTSQMKISDEGVKWHIESAGSEKHVFVYLRCARVSFACSQELVNESSLMMWGEVSRHEGVRFLLDL